MRLRSQVIVCLGVVFGRRIPTVFGRVGGLVVMSAIARTETASEMKLVLMQVLLRSKIETQ
jgi:hypothetical protein